MHARRSMGHVVRACALQLAREKQLPAASLREQMALLLFVQGTSEIPTWPHICTVYLRYREKDPETNKLNFQKKKKPTD